MLGLQLAPIVLAPMVLAPMVLALMLAPMVLAQCSQQALNWLLVLVTQQDLLQGLSLAVLGLLGSESGLVGGYAFELVQFFPLIYFEAPHFLVLLFLNPCHRCFHSPVNLRCCSHCLL
jgi:hypothetical protein